MTYDPRKRLQALSRETPRLSIHAETGARSADVLVYGPIGGWFGVDSESFARQIAALDVDTINVRVNSPGGDVFDGLAIMNALRKHSAQVHVSVEGLAASAASFIVQAGDTRTMELGSQMLVHDAWSYAIGNADELREQADVLDKVSGSIATVYAERAGGTADEWRTVMKAETWYSAEEATAAGLADAAEETTDTAAAAAFDLGIYAHAGRADAPAPTIRRPAATMRGGTEPNHTEGGRAVAFTDEQLTTMRRHLGLPGDADESTIVDALGEALNEQTAPPAAAPPGSVIVDAGQLAQLQADAQQGAQALRHINDARRDGIVRDAIADGRISAGNAPQWRASLERDEAGTAELLGALPKLLPVGDMIGTATIEASTDIDPLYPEG